MPFGDQIQEPGRLGRLPRVRRGRRPAAALRLGLPRARPALAWERAGRPGGIGQGELILWAGETITEESAIESPKPPREIRSNCFTSRPAAPLSH